MQATVKLATGVTDELSEAFTEMRGLLYLHAGTLLLKMAEAKEQQWRAVTDLAALCYLLAYQVRPPGNAAILASQMRLPGDGVWHCWGEGINLV